MPKNRDFENQKRRTFSGIDSYKPMSKHWINNKFNRNLKGTQSMKNRTTHVRYES